MKPLALFGGLLAWNASDWIASNDELRGGKSTSNLQPVSSSAIPNARAYFYGNLDTTALGGAGFASQRTATEKTVWDLSSYAGIRFELVQGDALTYTFILRDELPPVKISNETGELTEQSTIGWEYDFQGPGGNETYPLGRAYDTKSPTPVSVFAPWADFKPKFRGRDRPDAAPLRLDNIRRMTLMIRSFFGEQSGDFNLQVGAIEAVPAASTQKI